MVSGVHGERPENLDAPVRPSNGHPFHALGSSEADVYDVVIRRAIARSRQEFTIPHAVDRLHANASTDGEDVGLSVSKP